MIKDDFKFKLSNELADYGDRMIYHAVRVNENEFMVEWKECLELEIEEGFVVYYEHNVKECVEEGSWIIVEEIVEDGN